MVARSISGLLSGAMMTGLHLHLDPGRVAGTGCGLGGYDRLPTLAIFRQDFPVRAVLRHPRAAVLAWRRRHLRRDGRLWPPLFHRALMFAVAAAACFAGAFYLQITTASIGLVGIALWLVVSVVLPMLVVPMPRKRRRMIVAGGAAIGSRSNPSGVGSLW